MPLFVRPKKQRFGGGGDSDSEADDEESLTSLFTRSSTSLLTTHHTFSASIDSASPTALWSAIPPAPPTTAPVLPNSLPSSDVVLKPFQCDGIGWIVAHLKSTTSTTTTTHGGVILADEMGLGKTIQSIGAAFSPELLHPVTDAGRALLIVAPLSVLSSWKREIERVMTRTEVGGGGPTRRCPLRIAVYSGSVEDRDAIIASVEASVSVGPTHRPSSHGSTPLLQTAYDVFITTPDYLLRDAFFLSRLAYRMLVFDEAHRLKNFHTKLFRLLIREYVPRIPKRLLLTGTPLSNTPVELWSLILLCNFETLGMFHESFSTQLVEEMEAKKRSGGAAKAETTAAFDVLLKLRSRFVLRRLKEDVLELPPLREVVLASPLSPLQRKLYGAILVKDMSMVLGNHATQKGKNAAPPTALLNVVMQLRKCCNHPYMFPGVEKEPFVIGEHIVNHSGKMVILDRLLHQELLPHGHRVLLFSQFSYMLDILQDYCTFRKISHVRLDGSVRGEDRNEAVDTFQLSSHCNVFLLSTRAGGVGLTLTAADTVIFYDSDWNPQMDLQAQQRAHRIGQTKPVTVYRLSVSGTVESLMLNAAARKRTMASSFLRNAGGAEMSHGTAEDEPTDDEGTSRVDWKAALLWTAAAFPEIGSGHEGGGGGGLTMSKDSAPTTRDELTPLLRPSSSSSPEPSAESDNAWESFLRSLDLLAMLRADDGKSTTTTATRELNVGSVFVTESAASQRAAFELTLKRGAEVLKDLASKQALEARKAREQAAALEDAGGRKRRTNWEDFDDEDSLRRSATTLTATRKKTTELERWRRLEKLWKKASYHSGALPLGLELFTASPPSVTASIDAPLLETPSLTTTTDIVRSLDDPTLATHSVFGWSLLRAAEAELTKEQGTSPSIREESLRFCTVMASPPPPPSPLPPSSPDPQGEDAAAAAKGDGEEEEEDDERAADFHGEALEHVRGNVFAPQALPLTSYRNHKKNNRDLPTATATAAAAAKRGGELQLIVIPVNNSGTWSSGGLFGAMAAFAPSVAHRYYHAKEQQDLRLGDAHVFFSPSVSAWSRQMVLIVVQRASTMTGDSGGGLDPKSLTLAFQRIARYSSVVQQRTGLQVTVHFPHVPTLTTGAAYALDKIVAAHLLVPPLSEEEDEQLPAVAESELGTSWGPHQASRTALVVQRCCIYHYSRRGGDRGRGPLPAKRGREDSPPSSLPRPTPPPPPPLGVVGTTQAVYASSTTTVAISSHSFCFLPPFGPSSAALQRAIALQGGVLCSVDDAVFALMVEKKNAWNGGPLIIVGQTEEALAKWRPHGATVMTEGELAKIL